ncbi:MAG: DNA polymerase I [Acidimicrobiia bacterium]|nr:DNA polymerase I [Acidimicrobiia bacterium]
MPQTLVLLDGHSLAYRAFYALPSDMATPAGQVTNAVYGFTSMLIKLLGDEHPDALAVAWDVKGPTFRHEQYQEYKAQREAAPDLFRSQLPLIREVLDSMDIAQLGVQGFEADDVIATLARSAATAGWRVLVVTGDRDAFQLIDDNITVLYTRRGISDVVRADSAWVKERYDVTPDQYVEYAALRGDTSDNLPGVPGVGEKRAAGLLNSYGSLEGVFAAVDQQSPKLAENLAAAEEQVLLNRELMTLKEDVAVDTDPDGFAWGEWDKSKVREVFDALTFQSLWERLLEVGGETQAGSKESLEVEVSTELDAGRIANLGSSTTSIAVEPVHEGGELVGLVVAPSGSESVTFVPADSFEALAPVLADPGVAKVGHDIKSLARRLLAVGIDMRGLVFDTALAAYLVNPARRAPELDDLAGRVLGLELDRGSDDDGTADDQGAFDFDGRGPDLEAAGRRAVAIDRLVSPLTEQLNARAGLSLFHDIELPLVRILAHMEHTGIAVDRDYLVTFGDQLRERLAVLEKQIHEHAGGPFNVNSTLQLREILFEKLGLPIVKKTPKGAPSTDAAVLQKLDHPIVTDLLSYRELEKLRSTYVDALLPLVDDDGRVRGRFNQMAAATGRLSAEQPNLQNIPIRSEEGRAIRHAFVAAEGMTFVVADYSQIELRILAHLSQDSALVEAFRNGEDIHRATASRVFDVSLDEVTTEQRRRAKVINFGLLYGMEAYGLAQRLEIGRDEAAEHMDAYFSQFPLVQDFMRGIVDEAKQTGFTVTLLGRRRYLPELTSSNFRDRQMGERMALNAPIQGSAADIIKKAMIDLFDPLGGLEAEMLVQIHDELLIETPVDRVDDVIAVTRETMEAVVELDVPLEVTVASGPSLAATKA